MEVSIMVRHIGYSAACAALVLFATTSAEAREVRIDSRVAGSAFFTPDPATGGGRTDTILEGKGTLGRSSARLEGVAGPPGAPSARCQGFDFEIVGVAGTSVSTFEDLSQLYSVSTSTYTCGNLDGARMVVAEGTIVGGTGRFEGASGTTTLVLEGVALTPLGLNGFTGTVTGTLTIDE
jgi:hypothetical protein